MANPIVAILTVAGVVGTGAAAVSVNTQIVEQSQEPVYVTVEGQPVVIGGATDAILPKPSTSPAPRVVTRSVPAVQTPVKQQVQTQAAAPTVQQPAAAAPAPVAPPAAHTGGSGAGVSGEHEDEDEYEAEEVETEDVEDEEDEVEDDD